MTDDDGWDLSRRLHWEAEEAPPAAQPQPEGYQAPEPVTGGRVAGGPSFERRDLDRIDGEALDRRRQLWRDTAIILSGLVAVLLVANIVLPQLSGVASATPSPRPTDGGAEPSASPRPGETAPSIVDPGLGIDATRPPFVRVTEPPTGTAAPTHPGATPRPTARPTSSPAPTETPTPAPTPTPTPTPTPEVTPPPAPPVAAFTWSPGAPFTITFNEGSSGASDWQWDFGD